MGGGFFPGIVRVSGRWGVLLLCLAVPWRALGGTKPLAECKAQVEAEPRTLKGYICLMAHQGEGLGEVLRFLDARMRSDPQNPRPHMYAGVMRVLAGQAVDDREWRIAIAGFAAEHEVAGEVYATSSLLSARCGRFQCDEEAMALLRRARDLALGSGRVDLQQVAEVWTMKVAFVRDDMDTAEEAEQRLLALGAPRSLWIKSEVLTARAHLATLLGDYRRQRELYAELVQTLAADDPRRPEAKGGLAAAVAHLSSQGLESKENAERLLREAIAEQERAGAALGYVELGYLASRVQLAMVLGPTDEAFALLRSSLKEHLSRSSYRTPLYPRLSLAELLSTANPPRLEEALEMAEEAVNEAFPGAYDYEQARALVVRSRVRFRMGRLSLARADGLAALDHAERLRERQQAMPLRLRYAQSLSFAYQSLAGALTQHRAAGDVSSLDEAFRVMERLRARGLMEAILAEGRTGESVPVQPSLGQIQGALAPSEALLSFQIWRPEPTMDAPYREGSSWVTVVTRSRVEAFPIPNSDVLEPQIRAWTGLLERRDGSDRLAGMRLHAELLDAALAVLPDGVDRLILVPDGPLHRLPFDALSGGPEGPYLAERFAVSLAPSASLWLRLRAAPRLGPGKLLVLADPSEASASQAIRRDSTAMFGALVHARREAEAALSAFPDGSELRAGPPASESFLKSVPLDGVSLLHLATHAVVDERDPEHAAVVLAPGSAAEDGRLEPLEIGRLPLRGKTVVLAGCETSMGPVFRGEGVMSLARAFFGAGAAAVVGTLDRARDEDASVLFSGVYRALGRGVSIGEAVATAKREAIVRGAPPAAWADVVVLGEAEVRPRARDVPTLVPVALAGAVVGLVGLGARRRWRGRRWFGGVSRRGSH